ncbi:cupin domain-containing protein [Mucilaginibacter sp. PAMB04168]|uniref:cupin domain-containing protein n=1 Tax=Mucilaginibacter sp. PAMB04168 TaxID=3138567 RepID=UPI0031F6F2A9
MESLLSKENCLSHYKWGDNCDGWNFVDTEALSIKQELMPPNATEQLHYHEHATQFFFILSGTAIFVINGQVTVLNRQQGIEVKSGQKHRISNPAETDLEFLLYSHPSTKNDRINCE